mmetsp:Transcript_51520/g.164772  ORF Transcript_51520/g.164772 Transcript_51520/m.164772 type:complete len:130 (+) Transcript_51520:62-451(+)
MAATAEQEMELMRLSQELIDAVGGGDWETYTKLCCPNLTAWEPETRGECVSGLGFHKYYFNLPGGGGPRTNTTIISPKVTMLAGGLAAVVTYIRLVQRPDSTSRSEETRVWEKRGSQWMNVHFHRTVPN